MQTRRFTPETALSGLGCFCLNRLQFRFNMTPRFACKPRTRFLAFLLFYGACLLGLLPRLSFWLDEIIDLIGVRDYDFISLMAYVPRSSGGVPLGYIVQLVSVDLLGFSVFSARLPSVIFSLTACVGVALLAKRIPLKWPILAVILFAVFPLQLRYALEARPYAQALCLSVWATVTFFEIVERRSFRFIALYSLLIIAGLYTQPFTVFVPLAHLTWVLLVVRKLPIHGGGYIRWYIRWSCPRYSLTSLPSLVPLR